MFVALSLARAAFLGGKANVLVNLPSLNTSLAQDVKSKLDSYDKEFSDIHAGLEARLRSELGFEREV
ncbi:MAG TPA: hypothetical protein ENF73_03875 [Proteobacteria bacterium]|nr:hypothetical protein [Pseudomonadota bacterium]